MKGSLRGALIAMGILTALSTLFGCTDGRPGPDDDGEEGTEGVGPAAVDNESGIVSFRYAYDGSIGGNNHSYTVTVQDGTATFAYESMEHYDYGTMEMALPADFPEQLEALYKQCRVATWNGYHKYNSWVSDGEGFSLDIRFADGESLAASGSNAFPDGYGSFVAGLRELFAPYVQQLLDEQRQAKVDEGLHGTLTSILATFTGGGPYGTQEVHVLIMAEGVRDRNYDVRVVNADGEYFPEDVTEWRAVPDEVIDFPAVQAMVEQYGLITWYDWDKASDDPDAEWFQLSLDFSGEGDEEGMVLNAMGTAHPEGYDEFRAAFLTWLAKTVAAAKALPE